MTTTATAQHVTVIGEDSRSGFYIECSCGWCSERWQHRDLAYDAGQAHEEHPEVDG